MASPFLQESRSESTHNMNGFGAQLDTAPMTTDEKRLSARSYLDTPENLSTTSLMEGTGGPQDYDPSVGAKPHSPFYRHATSSVSVQQLTLEVKHSGRNDDPESGRLPSQDVSMDKARVRQSKLWPEPKKRGGCLGSLTKKQKLAVKLAIAALIIGTMIAIALGITVAVGGGVWKSHHQTGQIHT